MSTHDAEAALSFVRVSERFSVRFLSGILPIVLTACHAHSARPSQGKLWEEFSGEKAFAHVQRLVDLGPRPPASDAIEKSRDYIDNQLRLSGWQVTRQSFTDNTPRGKVGFVNLIAHFPGQGNATASFLLCSRWARPPRWRTIFLPQPMRSSCEVILATSTAKSPTTTRR